MIVSHLKLLYRAAKSSNGIAIRTDNPKLCIVQLTDLQKTLKDQKILDLNFAISPTNPAFEVWIYKKDRENEEKN